MKASQTSDSNEDSQGGSCSANVDIDLDDNNDTLEDQTIAKTIQFPVLQKQKHPHSETFLIPTICKSLPLTSEL